VLLKPEVNPEKRNARPFAISVLVHVLFLFGILQRPAPIFVAPSAVLQGENGTAVRVVYWPPASNHHEPAEASPRQSRIVYLPAHKSPGKPQPPESSLASKAPEAAPLAGAPYGSLASGPATGSEVRPALPLRTLDPVIAESELEGLEGSVIIEITIDDAGRIVQKSVIQGLTPAVDNKVMAALDSWTFRPATRDGVPISSKQDVYYHFPVRR
jgi:protein TonB